MRKRPPTMNRRRAFDRKTAKREARCEAQSLGVIALASSLKASAPCSCGECEPCVDLALLGGIAARLEAVRATVAGVAERVRVARKRPPTDERPRCGAKCRDGRACRAAAVWRAGDPAPLNGRCRMHGGLSTGPRTAEGRARSLAGAAKGRATRAARRAESRAARGETAAKSAAVKLDPKRHFAALKRR